MMTLLHPVVTEKALFLRDAVDSKILNRLPPAPAILRLPVSGQALNLILYRYDPNDPTLQQIKGGAVLMATFDFGTLPKEEAEAQTALPADVPAAPRLPPLLAGQLRLWLGGQEVLRTAIPETPRPIVPVALSLTVSAATLLHSAIQARQTLLHATSEGILRFSCSRSGSSSRYQVDQGRAGQILSGLGTSFSAPDVAGRLLPALIEQGVIRIDMVAENRDSGEVYALALAQVAGWLFEPEPCEGESWSGIPGISTPPLRQKGRMRIRPGLSGVRGGQIGNAVSTVDVPWFAAAPIGPAAAEALALVDL